MNHPRLVVIAALVVVALGALAGCGSTASDGSPSTSTTTGRDASAKAKTSATSTTTTSAGVQGSGADPDMDHLRGIRYCEVLLLTKGDGGFTADVWNSMGMSDCPPGEWAKLDAKSIAKERGALVAVLNGPRYWVLDSIDTQLRKGADETTFGSIGMFKAATLDLGDDPSNSPYTEREVARDTVFGFDAGSEVYELVAPDGSTYIMQARSQIVDEGLEESDLPTLGDRLELPAGWRYQVRTLDDRLEVLSDDQGIATVIQDELQNTYQRIDPPS